MHLRMRDCEITERPAKAPSHKSSVSFLSISRIYDPPRVAASSINCLKVQDERCRWEKSFGFIARIGKGDSGMRREPMMTISGPILATVTLFFLGQVVFAGGEESPSAPPQYRFTHLSIADGLSDADVRGIAHDHQGFLWFGTWLGGVNRYDGYSFKVYKHDARDDRSLSFDNVSVIFEDRQDTLWVGSLGGGLDQYDREVDAFVHYRHRPGDTHSLPDDNVRVLYEDEAGTFWVGTGGGLSRFDRETGAFFTYHHDPNDPASLGGDRVRAICRDRKTGLLWAGTRWHGVSVLDPQTGQFTRFVNDPSDPTSLGGNVINHIYQDRAGNLWLCTDGGLSRWDPEAESFVRYVSSPDDPCSLCSDYVTAAYEDREGRFWVGTSNGLELFDRSKGLFFHYRNDPNNPASLSDNRINNGAIYEDDTGALWIGTADGGINRLDGQPERFATYRHNYGDVNSLLQNTVSALCGDEAGNLWIGTDKGLDRFDGRNFVHYTSDPTNSNTISPGAIWAIAESPDHQLWIGTSGDGLCRFDGTNFFHYRHDPANPRSLGGDTIYGLQPDRKGGLWITISGAGLDYFDGQDFTHFRPDENDPDSLSDRYVDSLVLDSNGCVWMGSASMGLLQFDPATEKATTYLLDPEQPGSKVANWVRDICSDGKTIWVGAYSGLFRFDLASREFARCYTEEDGMANSSVVAVQVDAGGNVWVGTLAGLSMLDVRSKTFRNYDAADGLQSPRFYERSRTRMVDGRLCFGGVNGFNAFYPDRMPDNPIPPPVVLTEFQLFNKPAAIGEDSPLTKAIHVADRITLRYDQDVFRLRFAALDYTASENNRYAYKLEGFDKDWRYVDAKDRSATYTRLSPGEYTFRVRASNNDGLWNEQGASIRIAIIPPWWQTWWFRGGAAGSLLALLYAGFSLRIRSMHERSLRLEKQVTERTSQLEAANKELEAFAYSVSHDLRAPLRHIDGYVGLLVSRCRDGLSEQGLAYVDTIAGAARRMELLIDDLLLFSRTGRSEMRREKVDMNEALQEVLSELKESCADRSIEWVIGDLPSVHGDFTLLRQVWANLLGNAIKYTSPRQEARIEVGAKNDGDEIVFRVADNGVGFDMRYADKLFGVFQRLHSHEEFEGTGIGLATVQRIVSRHGGRVWAEAGINRGATFYFSFPQPSP